MNGKRYLVFSGLQYYPAGGWDDLDHACATLEEAKSLAKKLEKEKDWVQIVDLETMKEISQITDTCGSP